MLFNSYDFLLLFFPVFLIGYVLLSALRVWWLSAAWVLAGSFWFYMDWDFRGGFLLGGSILVNYLLSLEIHRRRESGGGRAVLALGLIGNLALLGYFKYYNFFMETANALAGLQMDFISVVLPIGISFFTFQQIAYLMDVWRGQIVDRNLLRYAVFVSFFPQLIAGPIVHHSEMMGQFLTPKWQNRVENLTIGLVIFTIGLAKKVIIADEAALYASPVFGHVAAGGVVSMAEAWLAALAYSMQIYFDFSGYSDMAIGLARMCGIVLPINFASPYKARSVIDFWRRWHITLSRFLRDYLYIPLGGNRQGRGRRYGNLLITMVLGGLWHGAGWTFVLWGALHGVLLMLNQGWRAMAPRPWRLPTGVAVAVTFLLVVLAWVPFRADSLTTTLTLWQAMVGISDTGALTSVSGISLKNGATLILGLLVLVWAAPNTQQLLVGHGPGLTSPGYSETAPAPRWTPLWKPSILWSLGIGCLLTACIWKLSDVSEFIYFQF